MRRILPLVLVLLTGAVTGQDLNSAWDLRVATLNVHYLSLRRDTTDWPARAPSVVGSLKAIDADLVAFQEMETFGGGSFARENVQLDYVRSSLPEYEVAAVGDPSVYPSTQPILYRPDVLQVTDQGFFFFSPEPDVIYSAPWHARFPAFASWVRFLHRPTGTAFVAYNIHFDVQSARNRTKSARLLAERAAGSRYADDPILILGDFNAPRFFPTMGILRRAGYARARANGPTFHFRRGINLIPAIDHVLGSPDVTFGESEVHRNRFLGQFPSDHHPVSTLVRF